MIAGAFNEWFTLCRKSRSSDGQGGWTYAWTQYATEHGRMSRLGCAARRSRRKLTWAGNFRSGLRIFCSAAPESGSSVAIR